VGELEWKLVHTETSQANQGRTNGALRVRYGVTDEVGSRLGGALG
jgi:hypothetical protein